MFGSMEELGYALGVGKVGCWTDYISDGFGRRKSCNEIVKADETRIISCKPRTASF